MSKEGGGDSQEKHGERGTTVSIISTAELLLATDVDVDSRPRKIPADPKGMLPRLASSPPAARISAAMAPRIPNQKANPGMQTFV